MPVYRRTYLVRQVEVWKFDPPDGLDVDDQEAFDDTLIENGEQIDYYVEVVHDDDLTIEEIT